MQNLQVTVKGNQVTITFDHTKRLGPSKSGKTIMVSTTGGNMPVPDVPGLVIGFNAYTKS